MFFSIFSEAEYGLDSNYFLWWWRWGLFINVNGDMNQMCVLSFWQRERENERDCVFEGQREMILEKKLYLHIRNDESFFKCYNRKRVSPKNQILACVKVLITYFTEFSVTNVLIRIWSKNSIKWNHFFKLTMKLCLYLFIVETGHRYVRHF